MNRFDSTTVLRKRRDNFKGAADAGEFRWEEIMVQITFAFLIILGYLLSSKAEDAGNLRDKVREQEEKWRQQAERSKMLEKLVQEIRHTELGEARAGRITAEKQLQLEKLFRVWAELRIERPLYRLLRRFENAEAIPLDDLLADRGGFWGVEPGIGPGLPHLRRDREPERTGRTDDNRSGARGL